MRSHLLALLLVGCGSVRLGEEPQGYVEPDVEVDVGGASVLDAGRAVSELRVVVTVSAPDAGCSSCVELTAAPAMGTPPYTFEWEDGSKLARRDVCAPLSQDAFAVTVRDAVGRTSVPHAVRVDLPTLGCADASAVAARDASAPSVPDASAPPVSAPLLCLANPSFEGKPAYNPGVPVQFDAPPWSDCTRPSRFNTPDILDESVRQFLVPLPAPTDGKTYLGLREGNQASQALCAPIRGGEQRSFRIDARKLDLSSVPFANSEGVFLSIFGGISATCELTERVWISPKLNPMWQTFCVTIAPQQLMDQLTLQAVSDGTLLTLVSLNADHIVPVSSCP
jgi:hypothetical protein